MKRRQVLTLGIAAFALAGCGFGQSRLNPLNWFGGDEESETVADVAIPDDADRRPLMPVISSLTLERTPGGVIVRATGLPPVQGWHDAALVSDTRGRPEGGVLTFAFRARPPLTPTRVSTEQSREVVVARFVSDITLAGTREIRVVGAVNTRSVRR